MLSSHNDLESPIKNRRFDSLGLPFGWPSWGWICCVLVSLLGVLCFIGCQQTRRPPALEFVSVSGKVTCDGKPLENAAVFFFPVRCWNDKGVYLPPSDALTDENGEYCLALNHEEPKLDGKPGAVLGLHHVVICTKHALALSAEKKLNRQVTKTLATSSEPTSQTLNSSKAELPECYNLQTELLFDVPAGGTDCANFNVELPANESGTSEETPADEAVSSGVSH